MPIIEIKFLAKNSKYYVVWSGRNPGVYNSWEKCKAEVDGMDHAIYKSFSTREIAEKAFQDDYLKYWGKDERLITYLENPNRAMGLPDKNSIAVDAACSGNPGRLEYRGVDMMTGTELFRQGPFEEGTVNIGEFLAIVHALALLHKKRLSVNIYSDSRTAIRWVQNRQANTKLERNRQNEKLFELIERAEKWLKSNTWENKILKWPTQYWGEIPADFGRK